MKPLHLMRWESTLIFLSLYEKKTLLLELGWLQWLFWIWYQVDVQALAHAVELTRQGAVDSLRFAKGDLVQAFQVGGICIGIGCHLHIKKNKYLYYPLNTNENIMYRSNLWICQIYQLLKLCSVNSHMLLEVPKNRWWK